MRANRLLYAVVSCLVLDVCLGYWPFDKNLFDEETAGRKLQELNAKAKEASVRFLGLGDWGAANVRQKTVAERMNVWAEKLDAQFVLGLGDNFYETGVMSAEDSQWTDTFEKVYNEQETLKKLDWWNVLGNHDWYGNATAQFRRDDLNLTANWILPNLWYNKVFYSTDKGVSGTQSSEADKFSVALVFTDSYIWDEPGYHPKSHVQLQLEFIEASLSMAARLADWIVVVGHYPMYSSGAHGDTQVLKAELLPLLQKYKVDMYTYGHDHHLELLRENIDGDVNDITYVLSGAGAKNKVPWHDHRLSRFKSHRAGFTAHVFTRDGATTQFVDGNGQVLHSFTQAKRTDRPCKVKEEGGECVLMTPDEVAQEKAKYPDLQAAMPTWKRPDIVYQPSAVFRWLLKHGVEFALIIVAFILICGFGGWGVHKFVLSRGPGPNHTLVSQSSQSSVGTQSDPAPLLGGDAHTHTQHSLSRFSSV
eukprot:GDKI01044470.1.p1 GENE.GDKI01044470.1~~GDKI01044470.1.p1  ORF type:complete len:499 (-),score=124.43 GDKI01044470.1:46-1473(-)